ncbi:MAG: hypothetical protein HY865_10005 [Chloroflexi bacterium]|nr:hypothetical protein [Chloroflexota bacterium]
MRASVNRFRNISSIYVNANDWIKLSSPPMAGGLTDEEILEKLLALNLERSKGG